MENAAKALLIVGGVLIAVLLLSLFSYLNMKMALSTSKIYEILNESEIAEFNQKFLNYKGRGEAYSSTDEENSQGNTPLTVQDVATILNLAQENNKNPKFPTTIAVYIGSDEITKNYVEWLKEMQILSQEKSLYKCTDILIDNKTLLVYKIQLEKI